MNNNAARKPNGNKCAPAWCAGWPQSPWSAYAWRLPWLEHQQAAQTEQQRTTELYESKLTHASLLAKNQDYAGAKKVLSQSIPLDGQIPSERQHARNLLAGYAAIRSREADKVYRGAGAQLSGGAAISPDGKWIAAAGERGTLVLFDAQTGELVKRLQGHDKHAGKLGTVHSIVFDPKGRWLFSGGEDKRIL